jgi:hypothetical protein
MLAQRPTIACLAAFAAFWCIFAAGAASGQTGFRSLDPRKNPVNKTLNHDPKRVADTIKDWSLSATRLLSAKLPVCFAYLIEDEDKPLSETFKQIINASVRSLRQTPKTLVVMQIQRPNGTDPMPHLLEIKSGLPARLAKLRFEYQPMKWADFETAARCDRKETIFIIGEDVQFYDRQLPPATVLFEKISMDSILFVTLRGQPVLDTTAGSKSRAQ